MANTAKRLGPLSAGGGGGGSSGTGYVKNFTTSTWVSNIAEYEIVINEAEHLKGTAPSVEVFELNGTYNKVHVFIEVSNAGEIKIKVPQNPDNRFAGKAIIS